MFITTNTKNRRKIFQDDARARIAVETLYRIQAFQPFFIYGFVIMPDHCHFLLTVPEQASISTIMLRYKRAVSFNLGEGPIWQSRFHVKTPNEMYPMIRYIHMNPVRAGLCDLPEDYPWSSASGKWDVTLLSSL